MARKFVLKAETANLQISPWGFLAYLQDYFTAAENWRSEGKFSPVPYFLYCRAIELVLKSYLLAKGETLASVKKLSHNLIKCLNFAIEKSLENILETTIIELNEITKSKFTKIRALNIFLFQIM